MSEEKNRLDPTDDEDLSFEEGVRRFGKWFSNALPTISAIVIAVSFIFYGAVEILPTQLSLKDQIIMAFITIIAGWSITTLIGDGGFTSAKSSKKFRDVADDYNNSVRKALKYRGAINQLAKQRAKENLKNQRIRYCEAANLWYWDIFDDNGYLKQDFDITKYKKTKKYRRKKLYYKKAIRLHIVDTDVFSKSGGSKFGIRKEANETTYRTKNGVIKFAVKVAFGIGSVGIMFNYLGFSAGAIIYAFVQVVIWTGMGIVDRIKNYNFVVDKIRPQIEDRTILIQEFLELTDEDKQRYIDLSKQEEQLKHEKIRLLTYNDENKTKE